MHIGGVGIWSGSLRHGDTAEIADAAAELEAFGYSALWIPGGVGGDVFGDCARLLDATERAVVATGILNLWMHEPADVAVGHQTLTNDHPGRFLLGIGVSHASLIDRVSPGRYARPVAATREFLDALDATHTPVPRDERVLAALGPKMLDLARDRTAGAHPYLVTPEHTALAREALGPDALLLPEQSVALETDPAAARALARTHLAIYLGLPNYTENWRRLGFDDDDFADGGSDPLVDTIVAWGDEATIARRLQAHFEAGADHVCIQVLSDGGAPRDDWRRLAPALVDLHTR